MFGFVIICVAAVVCAVAEEDAFYRSPTYSSVFYQRSIQPPYVPSGYRPNEPQFYFPSLRLQQEPSFQMQQDEGRIAQQPGQRPQYPNRLDGDVPPQGRPSKPRFPTPPDQVPFGVPLPRDSPTYNTRQPSDQRPTLTPVPSGRPRQNPTTTESTVEETTTTITTEEAPTTTEQSNSTKEVENLEAFDGFANGELKGKDELVEEGTYYIYHPSGLLQKVVYNSRNNFAKMDYTAMLKYENVEPIKQPIYTYDPNTYVFSQLAV